MRQTFLGSEEDQTGRVLVVDDEGYVRAALREVLERQGHEVCEATDGMEAMQVVLDREPDVVLLDIMMPQIDGVEVCRRLKSDPRTAPIPILLMTALAFRDERLRGIDAGANDFLTKPVDIQDIELRVRNAIYAKRLYDHMQENYRRLQDLERLRDDLTHMIVHDMKTPIQVILGYLETLKMLAEDRLDEQQTSCISGALEGTQRLLEMIAGLLDVSRLEAGEMPLNRAPFDLSRCARETVERLAPMLARLSVEIRTPSDPVVAYCDEAIIRRVITNLLSNAARFTPGNGRIDIEVSQRENEARVAIADSGPGIPPEFHQKIFEKFGQVEARQNRQKYSTGLGLTFCKLAVEAHGGAIGVESEPGLGSTFWFTLPAARDTA